MRVVLDENLPRSFGGIFEKRGFEILDIRDHGLRGAKDSAVFLFVKHKKIPRGWLVFGQSDAGLG